MIKQNTERAICIYCKEYKHNYNQREHVLPQAFGTFHPKNFVLNDKIKKDKTVCNDCNSMFGRSLELFLARDTFEGCILRSKYQQKSPNQQVRQRIILRAISGEYEGMYLMINEDNKVSPLPQVSLKKKMGRGITFH